MSNNLHVNNCLAERMKGGKALCIRGVTHWPANCSLCSHSQRCKQLLWQDDRKFVLGGGQVHKCHLAKISDYRAKQMDQSRSRGRKGWPRPRRRAATSEADCSWRTGQSPSGRSQRTSRLWRREWASQCLPTHLSPALKKRKDPLKLSAFTTQSLLISKCHVTAKCKINHQRHKPLTPVTDGIW